jgi:NDP-sugar pyrophosphorylase family protein
VGARVEAETNKNHAFIAIDEKSKEVLHYAENASSQISNLINAGIYMFSVRIFSEYGVNPFPDD